MSSSSNSVTTGAAVDKENQTNTGSTGSASELLKSRPRHAPPLTQLALGLDNITNNLTPLLEEYRDSFPEGTKQEQLWNLEIGDPVILVNAGPTTEIAIYRLDKRAADGIVLQIAAAPSAWSLPHVFYGTKNTRGYTAGRVAVMAWTAAQPPNTFLIYHNDFELPSLSLLPITNPLPDTGDSTGNTTNGATVKVLSSLVSQLGSKSGDPSSFRNAIDPFSAERIAGQAMATLQGKTALSVRTALIQPNKDGPFVSDDGYFAFEVSDILDLSRTPFMGSPPLEHWRSLSFTVGPDNARFQTLALTKNMVSKTDKRKGIIPFPTSFDGRLEMLIQSSDGYCRTLSLVYAIPGEAQLEMKRLSTRLFSLLPYGSYGQSDPGQELVLSFLGVFFKDCLDKAVAATPVSPTHTGEFFAETLSRLIPEYEARAKIHLEAMRAESWRLQANKVNLTASNLFPHPYNANISTLLPFRVVKPKPDKDGSGDTEDKRKDKSKDRRVQLKRKISEAVTGDDAAIKTKKICAFWVANGSCAKGAQCLNAHRPPTKDDFDELQRFASNTHFKGETAKAAVSKISDLLPTIKNS